jgi:hypothetical protein
VGDVVHAGRHHQGNQRVVGNDVTTERQLTDKQLDILHDHYKETFTRLREAETLRDRLFLWVIGIFALLILEIGYPAVVGGALGKLSIAGGEINLKSLPLPALLNATWVMALTLSLRYCQTSVLVNRQYPYLHALEEAISPEVGGGDLYQREGKVYLREYPLLLDVAWFAYVILFPLIVMFATLGLAFWEFTSVGYPIYHRLFDVLIAVALTCFFFLYRMQPALTFKWRKWQARRRNKQNSLQTTTTENSSNG